MKDIAIGIDLGTQGARAVALDAGGDVAAEAEIPFAAAGGDPARPEEDIGLWRRALAACLRRLASALGDRTRAVAGVAATSTSGTLCVVSDDGTPLLPAILYNDARAGEEAEAVGRAGAEQAGRLGYRFSPSFGLPKVLWVTRHLPDAFRSARWFLSPTDLVNGWLTDRWGISDTSNMLKMGYDLLEDAWPAFVASLGVPRDKLPEVVAPGTRVGEITRSAAEETGLAEGTPVLAGLTDGCASQLATGADAPGQWTSVLGTTLVLKGVSERLVRDPAGRVYCHRHPDGYWLPGGASNVGGEALARWFPDAEPAALDARARDRLPTRFVLYPLARRGERFPFQRPAAEGFALPARPADPVDLYAATLEGVAYTERLAYDVVRGLGAPVRGAIRTTGGGARSAVWLGVRADVLGRPLQVPARTGAAVGAAVLAASRTLFPDLPAATRRLVRIAGTVPPRSERAAAYEEGYGRFLEACRDRGYL